MVLFTSSISVIVTSLLLHGYRPPSHGYCHIVIVYHCVVIVYHRMDMSHSHCHLAIGTWRDLYSQRMIVSVCSVCV